MLDRPAEFRAAMRVARVMSRRAAPANDDAIVPTLLDYSPPLEPYLTVLHADRDFLIIDKPSGLLSVPGRHPSLSDSVRLRARSRFPTAEMVHRLDKDTSGLLLMALNKPAHARLGRQFEDRTTEKSYRARVWGTLIEDEGLIDLPIGSDWNNKPRQMIDGVRARPAQTRWRVLSREPESTTVALEPLTGRTHQLRVHMAAIGHPILGDVFYASGEALTAADRLQLHAHRLGFDHPATGERLDFVSPVPF